MEVVAFFLIIGLIPAAIANRKGYNFIGWWLFGAVIFPVALIMAFVVKPQNVRPCPFCAEPARLEASVCPHCQRDIEPVATGRKP